MALVQTRANNYTVERYKADHQTCCTENSLHGPGVFRPTHVNIEPIHEPACVRTRISFLTEKMSPDVARLCVDSEDALEARSEGWHWWPVAMQEIVVVL